MPRRLSTLLCIVVLCVIALAPRPIAVAQFSAGATSRISVSSDGTQGNGISEVVAVSADGRYVTFTAFASNLVDGDTNSSFDVFVRDRQTDETTRVSISSGGVQGNAASWLSNISADGRMVTFASNASNLVAEDTNNSEDIFVHDRQTGITRRVSVASDGTQANIGSTRPDISADGRLVVFQSVASNLVPGDTNNAIDIFVHDLQTGVTSRVSVASDGTQANHNSLTSDLSADGRFVAFASYATNLVAGGTLDSCLDIYIYDRQTGVTSLVSVSSDGTKGIKDSEDPVLSADGRYVAFSSGSHLVAGDTNMVDDIFVHDRQTGVTSRVSVNSSGTQGDDISVHAFLSADGRYVSFESEATNLVAGDTNIVLDVFVHDRQTGATSRVSIGSDGTQSDGITIGPAMSDDGRIVVFSSSATNLVAGDTNNQRDVFVHVREEPTPAPSIIGFDPASGPTGTTVAIAGADFSGAMIVAFSGVTQPAFTVNPAGTQITAAVPTGATTGKISVTTPGGTAQSASDFIVIPTPAVTGFSPPSGPVGTAVTIFGMNFAGATAVGFNGANQPAFTIDPTGTQIVAAVPAGATTGTITVTTPGGTAESASDFTVIVPPAAIYLSPAGTGAAGGKAFTGADILAYVKASNTWDVLFDASSVNITKNVSAFAFVGNDIVLGFGGNQAIAGLGVFAAHDLVRFTPSSLGYNNTAGSFAWFFDGSDVGLSLAAETLDALWIDAQGRLYISTTGSGVVPANSAQPSGAKVKFQDEDILRFTPAPGSTGATTTGTWTLYWNPTSISGMSAEDINGYSEDPATGNRYVTIAGAFNIGNTAYGGKFAGNGKTILRFAPNAAAPGGWAPAENVTWLAAGATFAVNIDGIEMAR